MGFSTEQKDGTLEHTHTVLGAECRPVCLLNSSRKSRSCGSWDSWWCVSLKPPPNAQGQTQLYSPSTQGPQPLHCHEEFEGDGGKVSPPPASKQGLHEFSVHSLQSGHHRRGGQTGQFNSLHTSRKTCNQSWRLILRSSQISFTSRKSKISLKAITWVCSVRSV